MIFAAVKSLSKKLPGNAFNACSGGMCIAFKGTRSRKGVVTQTDLGLMQGQAMSIKGATQETVLLKRLVVKAKKGDPLAVSNLIEKVYGRVLRYCFSLTQNEQAAHDLCQESIVRAIESIQGIKAPYNFLSWVITISRHLFLDSKRGGKNKKHLNIDDVSIEAPISISHAGLSQDVVRALELLSHVDRVILLLIDLQGYSYDEAAEAVSISKNAVRSRLHRARKAFLDAYKGAG